MKLTQQKIKMCKKDTTSLAYSLSSSAGKEKFGMKSSGVQV